MALFHTHSGCNFIASLDLNWYAPSTFIQTGCFAPINSVVSQGPQQLWLVVLGWQRSYLDVPNDPGPVYPFSEFGLSCLVVVSTEWLSWVQAAPGSLLWKKIVPFCMAKRSFPSVPQQIRPSQKRVTWFAAAAGESEPTTAQAKRKDSASSASDECLDQPVWVCLPWDHHSAEGCRCHSQSRQEGRF